MKITTETGFVDIPDETLSTYEKIGILKRELYLTDYKEHKYAEGWYTDEEYAPIKAEREALREHIRELENVENN